MKVVLIENFNITLCRLRDSVAIMFMSDWMEAALMLISRARKTNICQAKVPKFSVSYSNNNNVPKARKENEIVNWLAFEICERASDPTFIRDEPNLRFGLVFFSVMLLLTLSRRRSQKKERNNQQSMRYFRLHFMVVSAVVISYLCVIFGAALVP